MDLEFKEGINRSSRNKYPFLSKDQEDLFFVLSKKDCETSQKLFQSNRHFALSDCVLFISSFSPSSSEIFKLDLPFY